MTEENARLRDFLIKIEDTVVRYLASQPHDDEECRKHLRSAVDKVVALANEAGATAVHSLDWRRQ